MNPIASSTLLQLAEKKARQGLLGLTCREYLPGKREFGKVILGLHLRSNRSDEIPIFHESTKIYGFLKLQPGEHLLQLYDRNAFFLPRTLKVDLESYEEQDVLNKLGSTLPATNGPLLQTVALYPSINYPLLPGETVVWGRVTNNNKPVVFYLIQIKTKSTEQDDATEYESIASAYTDVDGVFVLRLVTEKHQDLSNDNNGKVTRQMRLYAWPDTKKHGQEALQNFPYNLDEILKNQLTFEQLLPIEQSNEINNEYQKVNFNYKFRKQEKDTEVRDLDERPKEAQEITFDVGKKTGISIEIASST